MKPSKSRKDRLLALERAERAVQLRQAGVTITQIGRELGISRRRVHQILDKFLTAAMDRILKSAKPVAALELARLDGIIRTASTIANNRELSAEVRLKALDRIERTIERRAKLLGLNAPEKIAPVNPDGQTPYAPAGVSDEERARLVAELLAKAQAKQEPGK